MVSFSCEACGDVLTKKKLDPHRNQCRGASFTCIDCMVHFQGTSYRSHTVCLSLFWLSALDFASAYLLCGLVPALSRCFNSKWAAVAGRNS
ncbi:LYAR-type C2HC zinc finger protein [Aspergillus novofumigatus IBT 16806]|uniref:Zinc finger C2H2 LYAR-type domain-containing protein n=1 Tax=Aspergillus novofumigatus (strain IBT 16806) TaxID=1392255 RepID=A0A2I1BZJ2_ASPN1|nr:uncharacterized protein P174DRAFT_272758 [Aspergillus novofumigatus IBT 16806]PKX90778.1 hypothetical protein P174DRAFT_272758 [Aspergillus novofumigatus IBT 16806]